MNATTQTTTTQICNKASEMSQALFSAAKGTGAGRGGFVSASIVSVDGIAQTATISFKNGDSDTYSRTADLTGWVRQGSASTGVAIVRQPRAASAPRVAVEGAPTSLAAEYEAMVASTPTASRLLSLMRQACVDLGNVNTERSCSRCGHNLTDPASVLRGIGPECNQKATKILATEVPTAWSDNFSIVFNFMALDAKGMNLPDAAAPVFQAVYERIAASPEYAGNRDLGGDWRAEVKALTWMASFDLTDAAVQTIFELIGALGYAGYAAYIRGDASGGKSRIEFIEGRLHVFGPRNREGRFAIKAIRGWKFHPAADSTSEASWSVPASKGDLFVKVVGTYWPLSTNRQDALSRAKTWLAENTTAVAEAEEKAAQVSLTTTGRSIAIVSPYSADFVEGLKALIPWKGRTFGRINGVATWTVDARYLGTVKSLIAQHYVGVAVVEVTL